MSCESKLKNLIEELSIDPVTKELVMNAITKAFTNEDLIPLYIVDSKVDGHYKLCVNKKFSTKNEYYAVFTFPANINVRNLTAQELSIKGHAIKTTKIPRNDIISVIKFLRSKNPSSECIKDSFKDELEKIKDEIQNDLIL